MLLFFGIEYPILWGVVAFLLNFIPFIGSLVASIPAIFLSLISADIDTTLMIIFFYLIINITISNILEPKVFGYELGLSPMIIFFSLIFFGWLLGIMGMFIAVPIVMTLKIAFNINEHTKWIGILLSNISKK
jgi:predicted PurR-regulated permease PerM